ncbi:MAG: OsmC family peroxiredoxin [Chloroflexi bacterium]|nr:OsmC family peroxiredoxin [Chloroflexota bacterium]
MSEIHINWVEKQRYIGIDSTLHSLVISTPDARDGGIGVKPSDLLLLAVGSCTAYDLVNILRKKRMKMTGLEIIVNGVQSLQAPWAFQKIHMEFRVKGSNITEKAVAQALDLSVTKYCTVTATLSSSVDLTTSYIVVNE